MKRPLNELCKERGLVIGNIYFEKRINKYETHNIGQNDSTVSFIIYITDISIIYADLCFKQSTIKYAAILV